jgi:hypothetical protein
MRFQTEEEQLFAATVPSPGPGQEIGLGVFSDARHHYLALLRIGARGRELVLRRVVDDILHEAVQLWPGRDPVRLEVRATPTSYCFTGRRDGAEVALGEGAARLLSAEACEWFVGVNFALCAFGSGEAATFAEVEVA